MDKKHELAIKEELFAILGSKTAYLEALSSIGGLRPVSRIELPERNVKRMIEFCNHNGFSIEFSDIKYIIEEGSIKTVPKDYPKEGTFFCYIGHSSKNVIEAKNAEQSFDHEKFGRLLGYPECCVKFFLNYELLASQLHNDFTLITLAKSQFQSFPWMLNFSCSFFDAKLISHYPCSFQCKHSLEIAERRFNLLEKHSQEIASEIKNILKTLVIYDDDTGVHVFKQIKETSPRNISYDGVLLTSPNTIHNLFQQGNNIQILDKHRFILGKDDELIQSFDNHHTGILYFT